MPAELLKPPALAPPTATLTPAIEAKAYFDSGLVFLNRKEYDKAIGDFTEAIRLDRNYTLAYFNRGLAYDYRGNYDKAVSDYNEAIRLEPNFVPSYFNRGIAYGKQGKYATAISDFTEAINQKFDAATRTLTCSSTRRTLSYQRFPDHPGVHRLEYTFPASNS